MKALSITYECICQPDMWRQEFSNIMNSWYVALIELLYAMILLVRFCYLFLLLILQVIGLVYRPYITIQEPGNSVDVREFIISPVVTITMALFALFCLSHAFHCVVLM